MAYINKIDVLIDDSLNNFYLKYIVNSKDQFFNKLSKERNFTQYQLKINKYIDDFMSTIKEQDIEKLVNSTENIIRIIAIIKRYIAYYVFLMIGYFYQYDKDSYTRNIVEFMLSQSQYNFKIDNFFNSDNNAILFKFFNLIKDVQFILNIKDIKKSVLVTPQGQEKYKNAILLLQSFDRDFVENNLKTKDDLTNAHNLIKIIVFKVLYLTQEKIDVMRILEDIEKEKSKYTYIKIVINKRKTIDYTAIEKLLSPNDIRKGLALEIYNFIKQQDSIEEMHYDDKIWELIQRKILVPISEDFLRYHKDTEKYLYNVEKQSFKKDDTKIKYIVTKLDTVSDYYSDNAKNNEARKKEIEKLFYTPLSDMKAVLVNDTEEITIINKIIKQNKPVEFFSDLLNYSRYPYVNFKNFKTIGISVPFDETIDLVRSTSFEFLRNSPLQLRVGADEQLVNIVGFMMFDPNLYVLDCIKSNKVMDIRKQYPNIKNGVEGMSQYIKDNIFNNKHMTPTYWLFDLILDTFSDSTRENITNVDYQKKIKYNLSKLYDYVMQYMHDFITHKINNMTYYSVTGAREIIHNTTKKFLRFNDYNDYVNQLEKLIMFDKQVSNIIDEPSEESKLLPLLEPNLFKYFHDRSHELYIIKCCDVAIQTTDIKEAEEISYTDEPLQQSDVVLKSIVESNTNNYNNAICQHIITWNNISSLKKKNPNLLQKLLYDFIQQYVLLTSDHEYACKSCGIVLNIKNYIPDGVYDDAEGRFKVFSIAMNVPMNDIPEYDSVIKSVKTMDKIIEKICSIANIMYFVGSTSSIKWRRQNLNKNIVDMMIVHNRVMKPQYKDRNEKAVKAYGIVRNISNLYFFDVDNNIFTYSSKEKDYYKLVKGNNAITYILIMLFLELNENFILQMGIDKKMKLDNICNIHEYTSNGMSLLEDLKIIINNGGDTEYVTKFPILSYCIYYFSCILSKYKLWYIVEDNKTQDTQLNRYKQSFRSFLRGGAVNKDFSVNTQRMIIHTIVDLLNSILEINMKKHKNYIYDIFASHFFRLLTTLFKNGELYNKLLQKYNTNTTSKTTSNNKLIQKPEVDTIPLTGIYKSILDDDELLKSFTKVDLKKQYAHNTSYLKLSEHDIVPVTITTIDNRTNCISGEYHKWYIDGNIMKCKICNKQSTDLTKESKQDHKIIDNTLHILLDNMSKTYCPTGTKHSYIDNICKICKKKKGDVYTKNELQLLYNNTIKRNEQYFVKQIKEQQKIDNEIKSFNQMNQKIYNELKSEYNKYSNNITELLINTIDSIVGKIIQDTSIVSETTESLLIHNTYIITHDHAGHKLIKPNVISQQSIKIYYNTNHNYFKTNVMYFNEKGSNIEMYYDTITNIYLGYRKNNREYINADPNNPNYIIINYSISKKLELLGYSSIYVNVKNKNKIKVIKQIQELRTSRLKSIIQMIQRALNRLKYSEESLHIHTERKFHDNNFGERTVDDIIDPTLSLIQKYKSNLSSITIDNTFKNWESILNFYDQESKIDLNKNDDLINILDINKYDVVGNVILYYIIRELNTLINDNKAQRTKIPIVNFVTNLITIMYDYYNVDTYKNNIEIRKFKYILRSTRYIKETESIAEENHHVIGPYEEDVTQEDLEKEDYIEEVEDSKEATDALDVENMGEDESLRDFATPEFQE